MTADTGALPENGKTLWQWLPEFLRHELAPYPGRWSLVGRMVIAATLSMIVIITFRIPYGAIGVNCAFILSRENLTSTAKSGFYFILAFAVWAALMPVGARMFASIPITHFVWEGVTAFVCFFLLKTLTNFPLAAGVVVVGTATMAIWYLPGPAELNVELTLWQILATAIGALITFLVEVVFRYWSPRDPLLDGIDDRLRSIQAALDCYSEGAPLIASVTSPLTQYAVTGAGVLRQQIARNHSSALQRTKMNAIVSLLSRSVDFAAALVATDGQVEPSLRERAEALAKRISAVREAIRIGSFAGSPQPPNASEATVLFSDLETTIGLIESVLATGKVDGAKLENLDDPSELNRLFVKDAFANPEYLQYALAGTAASMLCYVIYVGLNWPGISTAVTTCVLTALSNIGSSRQKQILRIVGASIGGFVLGVGSQIFVLPYIDSITGLTILFALVTGVSAYVATSSPRLSYVGLQMAFAFYLINVTDFSLSMDLTIGRDRAVGVLLGIAAMWLVFERLYSRPAGIEMVAGFARSVRLIANLNSMIERGIDEKDVAQIHILRDHISGLFSSVNAEADAVPFEGGDHRLSHLAARDRIRRWLSTLRTVFVLELPILHARLVHDPKLTPTSIQEEGSRFYEALSASLIHVADCLQSQLNGTACDDPQHDALTDSPVPQKAREHISEPPAGHDVPPTLGQLSMLVRELEKEVLEQPVFQPRSSAAMPS